MDKVFCTVLSRQRLYQAIALFCSLHEVLEEFSVYTLCVDDETFKLLNKMNWTQIKLIHINEIKDEAITDIKEKRKLNEYCWTLKPVFLEYLFGRARDIKRLTYVDSDIFFFDDPSVIFQKQPENSVLLSRGDIRIPSLNTRGTSLIQSILGTYNSGFISFLNDENGLDCVRWWKSKCLECCVCMPEGGKFGDQKYLDEIPGKFNNVAEIKTPGVNVGHWNSYYYKYSCHEGRIYMDLNRLICYHFSGFRVVKDNKIILIHEADKMYKPFFYDTYINILHDIVRNVQAIHPGFPGYADMEDLGLHRRLQI